MKQKKEEELMEKAEKGIDQTALNNTDGRAYGGIVRAGKGELVESIAKTLIKIARKELKKEEELMEKAEKGIDRQKEEVIRELTEEETKEELIKSAEAMNANIKYYIKEFEETDFDVLKEKDRLFLTDAIQTHIKKVLEETQITLKKVS